MVKSYRLKDTFKRKSKGNKEGKLRSSGEFVKAGVGAILGLSLISAITPLASR